MGKLKPIHFFASVAIAAGIGAISYAYLRRKYTVLDAQNIRPSDFGRQTVELFLLEDKNHDNAQRLQRAMNLLEEDADLAGFLAFTTFERHLRAICHAKFGSLGRDRGLLNLAKKLRSAGIFDRPIYEKIKGEVCHVRNSVIHGEVYCQKKLGSSHELHP